MKLIAIIQDGHPQLGGFQNVQSLADRYVADGIDYPFVVLAAGHHLGDFTDAPPVVVPAVPQSVTMRQARIALYNAGKLSTVNAAIAGMAGAAGDAARIEWEFSSAVERNKPLVASLGAVLGMDGAALDLLFIAAEAL